MTFLELRSVVFKAIKQSLEEDGHCKSYEGTFRVIKHYPNYFENENKETECSWTIELYCYLIGPQRHYQWSHKDYDKCLEKCEKDILSWIGENNE